MASKPIKKRAPRKAAKKRFSWRKHKDNPTALHPIPSVMESSPPFEAEQDPFYIDPKSIPKGRSYQWVTSAPGEYEKDAGYTRSGMMEGCLASGWKPVKGKKSVGGQTLMWAPKAMADAQRDANTKLAQDQIREYREMFGMDTGEGRKFALFPSGNIVSEPYQNIPSDALPIDCEITVKLRLSHRYQDAAAALHLDPKTYAQRRLDLYIRGSFGGILLPVDGGALELFEGGNFNIHSRI